jgi:hypothetical protein
MLESKLILGGKNHTFWSNIPILKSQGVIEESGVWGESAQRYLWQQVGTPY